MIQFECSWCGNKFSKAETKDIRRVCPQCNKIAINKLKKQFRQPTPLTWWETNNWWLISFPLVLLLVASLFLIFPHG